MTSNTRDSDSMREREAFEAWCKSIPANRSMGPWEIWQAACDSMRSAAAQTCESVAEQSRNSLFRSGAKICAGEIRNPIQLCDRAPEGWQCSRVAGHDGPCAASQSALPRTSEQADEAVSQYGPYEVVWLGAGVWAGITEELHGDLAGHKVFITRADK
ncbi:MAG: hypothetical protein CPSOU_1851 [uncultured Paraburkholderia sp.]|nr:MAG: hypothetical protein CPSOU_1851 [uncultured Paraburkholderia sp.]